MPLTIRRPAAVLILALAACSDASGPDAQPSNGVDLGRLFAAPTATEISAVRADWALRAISVSGFRVEATLPLALGSS